MGVLRALLFPTFVLIVSLSVPPTSFAAKTTPSPDIDAPEENKKIVEPAPLEDRGTVDVIVTPPPKSGIRSEEEYFHPFRHGFSLRAGRVSSSVTTNDTSTPYIGGVQFMFTAPSLRAYEAAADLLSDGTGALHLARRWIYTRTKLRPFTKAGFGILVKPEDALAFLVNFSNYRVHGAAGAEYLLRKSQSLRIELEAAVSMKVLQINATVGYVFAW